MTALSDALALAATAASGKAAAQTAAAAATPAGSTPAAIAAHIALIVAAGSAIRAAGGAQVQAGLANAALNGWVGRSNPNGVKDSEGVCGFSLAGVDDVSWLYELHRQTNDTPNYSL